MLIINSTEEELEEYLGSFVWTFKIGDNIVYNLRIIFKLIENKLDGGNYAKPISILCVSVVEAILIDFLERLDSATNHFPGKLNGKRESIKSELDTKKYDFQTIYEEKVYQYKRLRNFGYTDLIEFCDKFKILGIDSAVYKSMRDLGRFRNRVHIRNYFGNFERDESRTFSEMRTQKTIDFMEKIFKYFYKNYSRP